MAFLPGYSKYADLTVNGALMPGGGLSAAASGWQTVAIPAGLLAVCQPDLRDLRITTDDGVTLVDYAIESIAGGIVWVRPAAWSSGLTSLRAYGGHASAVDAQNWPAVTSGWAGVWPLGDAGPTTAADKTGNGNHGTQSGGVTFGSAGRVDGACSFDGADSALLIADPVFPVGNVDLSFWVKPAFNTTTTFNCGLITAQTAAADKTIQVIYYNAKLRIALAGQGGYNVSLANYNGTWVHMHVRVDASLNAYLWLDGAYIGTGSAGTGPLALGNLQIGKWSTGVTGSWNGAMDQVAITTSALSADQIKLLATFPGHASQTWAAVQDVPSASLIPWLFRRNRILGGGVM